MRIHKNIIYALILFFILSCLYAARIYLRTNPTTQTQQVYVQGDLRDAHTLEIPSVSSEERSTILAMCHTTRSMAASNQSVVGYKLWVDPNDYHLIGEYKTNTQEHALDSVTYPFGAGTPQAFEQLDDVSNNAACVQVGIATSDGIILEQMIAPAEHDASVLIRQDSQSKAAEYSRQAYRTSVFVRKKIDAPSTCPDPHAVCAQVKTIPLTTDADSNTLVQEYTKTYGALFPAIDTTNLATPHNYAAAQNSPFSLVTTPDATTYDVTSAVAQEQTQQVLHLTTYQVGGQYLSQLSGQQQTPLTWQPYDEYQQYNLAPTHKSAQSAERLFVSPQYTPTQADYERHCANVAAHNKAKYDKPKYSVQLYQSSQDYLSCSIDGLPIDVHIHFPLKPSGGSVLEQLAQLERMRQTVYCFNEYDFAALLSSQTDQEFTKLYNTLWGMQLLGVRQPALEDSSFKAYCRFIKSSKMRQEALKLYDLYQFPGFSELIQQFPEYEEHILELANRLPHMKNSDFDDVWGYQRQRGSWWQIFLPWVYDKKDTYPFRDRIRKEAARIEQQRVQQARATMQNLLRKHAKRTSLPPQHQYDLPVREYSMQRLPAEVVFLEEFLTATEPLAEQMKVVREWTQNALKAYEQADDATYKRYYTRVARMLEPTEKRLFAPSPQVLTYAQEQKFPACLTLEHGGLPVYKALQLEAFDLLDQSLAMQKLCADAFYLNNALETSNLLTTIALGHLYENQPHSAASILDISDSLITICKAELRDYGTQRDISQDVAQAIQEFVKDFTGILEKRLPELLLELPVQMIVGTAFTTGINALIPSYVLAKLAIALGIGAYQFVQRMQEYNRQLKENKIHAHAQLTADCLEFFLVGYATYLLSRDNGFFKQCLDKINAILEREAAIAGAVAATEEAAAVKGIPRKQKPIKPAKAAELEASKSAAAKTMMTKEELAQVTLKPNSEASILNFKSTNSDNYHIFGNQTTQDGLAIWNKHKWNQTGKTPDELARQLVNEIKNVFSKDIAITQKNGNVIEFNLLIEGNELTIRGFVDITTKEFSVGTVFIK